MLATKLLSLVPALSMGLAIVVVFLIWIYSQRNRTGRIFNSDGTFWVAILLFSYVAPIAYLQSQMTLQRVSQFFSISLIFQSIYLKNLELKSKRTKNQVNGAKEIANNYSWVMTTLTFFLYLYISGITFFAQQPLTASFVLMPIACLALIYVKPQIGVGISICRKAIFLICLISLFPVRISDLQFSSIVERFINSNGRILGITLSQHDLAYLAGSLLLFPRQSKSSKFSNLEKFISIFTLAMAASRGIIMPLLFVLLIRSFFLKKTNLFKKILISTTLLFFSFITTFFLISKDHTARTLSGRTTAWPVYVNYIKSNLFFGNGAGIDSQISLGSGNVLAVFNTPHNGFIATLLYGGLIAFIALMSILSLLVIKALKSSAIYVKTLAIFLPLTLLTETRLNYLIPNYSNFFLLLLLSELSRKNENRKSYSLTQEVSLHAHSI
jgi:hypothetical protein